MNLPANVTAYLNQLAADIAANGGLEEGQNIMEAAAAAHARRQAFALEMAVGTSDRAKMVRQEMAKMVYADLRAAA